ncbi:MAG: tRNA dihydrouridine(20/20a) synthase DusA [Myxococcales bacterium]|nr:tRNA dihydrouridine(20/20a) synthase DusA [Myxococcales bacterium]
MEAVHRGEIRALSIAPMMERTDRHFRAFLRCLTHQTLLYTEMVHGRAVVSGNREKLLGFDSSEHPIALQLGGEDPDLLAQAAKIAEDWGYDEVNLNVGCPSDRVQSGCFGAALMARPERVAEAVAAMRQAVSIPVTVKHRIGIDDLDRYEDMLRFVDIVSGSHCDRFSVHARKAWLSGLSPKENRNIPPLRYEEVYRLKSERPEQVVEINGGIKTLDQVEAHLQRVDAVMVGRGAYDNPGFLLDADRRCFGLENPSRDLREALQAYRPYIAKHVAQGGRLHDITRHLMGLFAGQPGARRYRRYLGQEAVRPGAGLEVLDTAVGFIAA